MIYLLISADECNCNAEHFAIVSQPVSQVTA